MAAEDGETSDDRVLGGRLVLRQPWRGHRFGHDAILLAAATGGQAGQRAVELGAGVGAAGLALASRIGGLAVTLVEVDPALAALAEDNAKRNGLADRARAVCLDVTATASSFSAAGLPSRSAERVLMNPPFNVGDNASPDAARQLAYTASPAVLEQWIDCAARLLVERGVLTLIWRADGLAGVLAAFSRGFGALAVLPVYPKPQAPAIRILVRAQLGSRAPLALFPGLVLADADGVPSPAAEAILRDGQALAIARL